MPAKEKVGLDIEREEKLQDAIAKYSEDEEKLLEAKEFNQRR